MAGNPVGQIQPDAGSMVEFCCNGFTKRLVLNWWNPWPVVSISIADVVVFTPHAKIVFLISGISHGSGNIPSFQHPNLATSLRKI
jgi:hypothetical protein